MLVRKLTKGGSWKLLLADRPDITALDVPGDLFSEFIPRDRDKFWLSLYKIDDEGSCADIGAALSFLLKPGQSSEQFFLALEDEALAKLSLETKESAGDTFHSDVDSWHREVKLETAGDAIRLMDAFLQGELWSAKGSQIDASRTAAIRSGQFRVAEAAKNPRVNDNPCGHILVHVGSGGIVPVGSP